jgi:hypothetical protein
MAYRYQPALAALGRDLSPVGMGELLQPKGLSVADRLRFTDAEGQIRVERLTQNNVVLGEFSLNLKTKSHWSQAAKTVGLKERELHARYLEFRRTGISDVTLGRSNAPVLPPNPPRFTLKDLTGGIPPADFPTFDEALAAEYAGVDPSICWDGTDDCCCLDVDFHGDLSAPPDWHNLSMHAEQVQPAPAWYWRSKSGGIHALYQRLAGIPADELAAVAGLYFRRMVGGAVELKHETRRPPASVVPIRCTPTSEIGALGSLYCEQSASDEEVAAWLTERGFIVGERYCHTACPVAPSERAAGNSPPVVIYPDHVYCYICAADGVLCGAKAPGWFPYFALCGESHDTLLKTCVDNFTHWDHAKYVVGRVIAEERLARQIYSACLRKRWGDDPRVDAVFVAGRRVLRFHDYWGEPGGRPLMLTRTSPILMDLPAAQRPPDEEGQCRPDGKRCEWFAQSVDLTAEGYPPLVTIWGCQLTANQDLPSRMVFTVLPTADLAPVNMRANRPRYIPAARRMKEEDAWTTIERAYPKVNRQLVKLLIAAKGCAEYCSGLPPFIFLMGPTGSGKTGSPMLAASICGDSVKIIPFNRDTVRLRQGMLNAKQSGSFAVFDEFLKQATAHKMPLDTAMEVLLGFTPNSVSHEMYIGPVALGTLPVCIWCDTTIPPEIQQHQQIGRRMIYHRLDSELSWEDPLRDSRICKPELLRVNGGSEYIAAANAILSDVIDAYFAPGPPSDFEVIAKKLGFAKLRDSDTNQDRREAIRTWFAALCSAPELTGPDKRRWPHPAWRMVYIRDSRGGKPDPLTDAWLALMDAGKPTESRAIAETDLQVCLGLSCPARLETKGNGERVVMRIANSDQSLFNGEMKSAMELEPNAARVGGSGDAERSESPAGGG